MSGWVLREVRAMAKRKSNGDGSISRLPSGSWRGQLMDGYTAEGKRNVVSFTAPTKGEVQRKIREYFAEKEAGNIVIQEKRRSFAHWADSWYEDHKDQVQASTYSGYQYTLKLIKECFKNKAITDIKPVDINKFLREMAGGGCSNSKISKCRAMLIQIFTFAESNEAISRNPAKLAKIIRDNNESASKKDAFTDEEVQMLREKLPEDKLGHSIRLLFGSGIRVQELLALVKSDIAEDGSSLEIQRAVKMVDGKAVVGPTKSKASMRTVPIPEAYRESATYLREHSGEAFIWCSGQKNLVYGIGTFRRWYYRALKEVEGVRLLPPHCCRHTYVSRLEAKGVAMEKIARLVGHTKISTTDGYLHMQTKTLREAVDVLNDKEDV